MTLTKPRLFSAFFASTCLSSLALSLPAQAATFSSVKSWIQFSNFSHPAQRAEANTFTDTLAISSGGSVVVESNAEADFISGLEPNTETTALNLISSHAAGSGGNYLGLAQSEASLGGDFYLAAQETFSFSFKGFLALSTVIDNPTYESAFALGFLGFSVWEIPDKPDAPNLLIDELGLLATLNTPGSGSSLDTNLFALLLARNTDNIVINALSVTQQISGLEESLSVGFSGTYSKRFAEATRVSLGETKVGAAAVQQVPTPSLIWGMLTYGGLGLWGKLRKRLDSL